MNEKLTAEQRVKQILELYDFDDPFDYDRASLHIAEALTAHTEPEDEGWKESEMCYRLLQDIQFNEGVEYKKIRTKITLRKIEEFIDQLDNDWAKDYWSKILRTVKYWLQEDGDK